MTSVDTPRPGDDLAAVNADLGDRFSLCVLAVSHGAQRVVFQFDILADDLVDRTECRIDRAVGNRSRASNISSPLLTRMTAVEVIVLPELMTKRSSV